MGKNPRVNDTAAGDIPEFRGGRADNRSIEAVYLRFRSRIKEFVRSRVADEHTAEDIVQDVFVKVHSNLASLKQNEKLEPWIYRIARNAVIDHYRKMKASPADLEDIPADDDRGDDAFRKVAGGLKCILDTLPEEYREALELTEFGGMTRREYAALKGLSVSGAKSRVQRARAMLKEGLLQCCHFEFDRFGKIIDYHPRK